MAFWGCTCVVRNDDDNGANVPHSYIWLNSLTYAMTWHIPDSNAHEANMGPIWGRQDQGGPHVGPMNLAIWDNNVLKDMW